MSKCRRKTCCVIVLNKRFHSKRSMFFRPTLHDDRRLQTALPSDVFHRATCKHVGMALNLNRLIVSAPLCIFFIYKRLSTGQVI
jgi:hypothetical protein